MAEGKSLDNSSISPVADSAILSTSSSANSMSAGSDPSYPQCVGFWARSSDVSTVPLQCPHIIFDPGSSLELLPSSHCASKNIFRGILGFQPPTDSPETRQPSYFYPLCQSLILICPILHENNKILSNPSSFPARLTAQAHLPIGLLNHYSRTPITVQGTFGFPHHSSPQPRVASIPPNTDPLAPRSLHFTSASPQLSALMLAWRHLHAPLPTINPSSASDTAHAQFSSTMDSSSGSLVSSPRSVLDFEHEAPLSHIISFTKVDPASSALPPLVPTLKLDSLLRAVSHRSHLC